MLSEKKVNALFTECLFKDGENTDNAIIIEGIVNKYGFNPERISEKSKEIFSILLELPNEFMKSGGSGYTFLNACMDKNGNHWGEHRNMEELFCLGIAIGKVHYLMPREMWSILPGGMLYLVVDDAA